MCQELFERIGVLTARADGRAATGGLRRDSAGVSAAGGADHHVRRESTSAARKVL